MRLNVARCIIVIITVVIIIVSIIVSISIIVINFVIIIVSMTGIILVIVWFSRHPSCELAMQLLKTNQLADVSTCR